MHFAIFSLHLLAYSLADTAIISLIINHAPENNKGSILYLNNAGQAISKIIAPILAGTLYEKSKNINSLKYGGKGSLPFILGGLAGPILSSLLTLFYI